MHVCNCIHCSVWLKCIYSKRNYSIILPEKICWIWNLFCSPSQSICNCKTALCPVAFPVSAASVWLAWHGEKRYFPGSWAVSPGPGWGQPLSLHSPAESHHRCQAGRCRDPHHCCRPPSRHTLLRQKQKQAIRTHIISKSFLFVA